MKRITLFMLLVSLLLPMSLSAQSIKAGAQKIKANVAKIEAGAVKGDRTKTDNRLASRANGISPKSVSVEVGNRGVNRVRRAPVDGVTTWDFEDASQFGEWTAIDSDGDGFNWQYFNNTGVSTGRMTAHEGEGLVAYASYDKESEDVLHPDNWLISPEVTLGGGLTLWACGQDDTYCEEVFGIYVCIGDPTNVSNFVQVGSDVTTTYSYIKYEFDLSAYEGQTGYFAIRHYRVSDMFWLNINDVTLDLNQVVLPDPTVPTNLTVAPGATTADVTWEDTDDEAWNLRWRPWTDLSGNPHSWDFSLDTYESQIEDWWIYDADEDGYSWGLAYSSDALDDVCLYSYSWSSGSGGLTPDNYVGTPDVPLKGVLRFTVWGASDNYPDVFQVYAKVVDEEFEDMHPLFDTDLSTTEKHQTYEVDLSAFEGAEGCIIFRHYNCEDQMCIYIDDVYVGDPDAEWIYVNGLDDTEYTIEDLTPETDYVVQVQACNEQEESEWTEPTIFTTLVAGDCEMPTNLAVSDIEPRAAQVSWEGTNDGYNVRYREVDTSSGTVTIILTAGDVWEDGTGYQMLLDANATAYGTIIPETGALTTGGNVSNGVYDEFEYKIPTNAEGALDTDAFVMNNSVAIQIPAGTYDWCITNPTPGDRMWIASHNGNVGGRQNDYVFEAGKTYEFTVSSAGNGNDQVNVTITQVQGSASEWTKVEDVTSPYNITGLTPETVYEIQVQGDCGDEQSNWSPATFFTTLEACPVPFDFTVEPGATTADVDWEGFSDSYNLRYRTAAFIETVFTENWDDETGPWTDSNMDNSSSIYSYGIGNSYCFIFMFNDNPPQYLISPELDGVTDGMKLEFYYKADNGESYPETFQVGYSSTNNETSSFDFGNEITVEDSEWHLFSETIPAGTKYFCVKYNSDDQDALYVDNFVVAKEEEIPAGEWTNIEGIEDTKYEITGLEPDTWYEVQVQGVCDETETAWTETKKFATLEALVLLNDDLAEEVKNSDKLTEAVSTPGTPVNVLLKDRTFFKDGNWNTLFLPFNVIEEEIANSPLAGATIKKFYDGDVTGTHVDIVFTDATAIEAGEFYIFKWNEGEDISNPVFKNVEIENAEPYYSVSKDNDKFTIYGNNDSFATNPAEDGCYTYYLTSNGELKYSDKYRVLKTFRIFFRFTADNGDAGALEFNLNFDDGSTQTGIVELDGSGRDNRAPEGYYNLQGVKYNGKPIQKGVYINNGHKVVVK